MKELLLSYARYNVWANKQMIDTMLQLGPDAVDKEVTSSFPSLRTTVYHIWGAEDIWLQRLQHVAKPTWAAAGFEGSFEEACHNWEERSAQLMHYVAKMDDAALHNMLHYNDIKGNPYQRHIWEVLQHVCNHSTYHRGQLVAMLRQCGATAIPQTDFSFYLNQKQVQAQ
ncbi:MAG: DinB family protein [Flavipsychrobacter sp.]|jgi:uncharacterized damage-inducible protein DinB|nr:DinB family protein [Flavipsychrobacter sp.]